MSCRRARLGFDVGAFSEQGLRDFGSIGAGGPHESRLALPGFGCIRIGAVCEQQIDDGRTDRARTASMSGVSPFHFFESTGAPPSSSSFANSTGVRGCAATDKRCVAVLVGNRRIGVPAFNSRTLN